MQTIYLELFIYLLILSFIIRTVRNILYYAFLWQLKEYRIDRLLAHLQTDQGRKLILGPISVIKWILLLFIVGSVLSEYSILSYAKNYFGLLGLLAYLLFGLIWVIEAVIYLRELIINGWKIPVLTVKIIVILIVIFFFQFMPLINGNLIGQLMLGPFVDKLLAPVVFFFIMITNIISLFFRKIIVALATRKIAKLTDLKVVGITGSYGKTSTKEFLTQILATKFKVLRTAGFINTEIGVAQTVLKSLTPNFDIFIAEMGAYKKGEIEAICTIVKPQIGIITGINQQHLQLFGSLNKIMEAKFELVKNLKSNGLVVINGDCEEIRLMASWTQKERPDLEINIFGKKDISRKMELSAENIETDTNGIKFNLVYQGNKKPCRLNLAGSQNVSNFLGAVLVALNLGFSLSEIIDIAKTIQAPPKTMRKLTGIRQATFIDDTFNANPDGVMAALEFMKVYKGKKILVLTPLIELGKEGEKIHKVIGEKAAMVCDLILLTNFNYNKSIIAGAKAYGGDNKVQLVNTIVGANLINKNIDKGGVVVFEGKEAGKILSKLVKSV